MSNQTDKEKVWERLNYVPVEPFVIDYDVNSMYSYQSDIVLEIRKSVYEAFDCKIKVLKNRG